MIHKPVDYSLYLVTDEGLSMGRSNEAIVEAAIQGGVSLVQYREKNGSTLKMITQAMMLCEICHAYKIPFIINDRIDVALAVGADGVHVGQDDMPASLARKLIGPNKLLGVSVGNLTELDQAIHDGADYVGASPIFATPTKPDAPKPMGIEGLKEITASSRIPVVAIGGMNEKNAAEIIGAGANGLAVVSAIISAEDVKKAAYQLSQKIKEALQNRQPLKHTGDPWIK